jgi:YHS domain-containing protein
MKAVKYAVLVMVMLLFAAGAVMAAEEMAAPAAPGSLQKICPVTGNPVNPQVYVDYQGNRIYFCCNSCPPGFNKDPEKYMKKMRDENIPIEKTPAM